VSQPDPTPTQRLASLTARLAEAMALDRFAVERRLGGLRRRLAQGQPVDRSLAELERSLAASCQRRTARLTSRPAISYPEALPVSAKRAEIAAAIAAHPVVVVAGETGSGKTTQLPKICLELGRGSSGFIGHTQPRRLAARSVAARIAEELASPLGTAVGFKIRFSDRTRPESLVKLMTDGILLAEAQHDPLLAAYDTLIIDEAHERSLNIDFLLGYLRNLLPRRPDLKLIITSATINTEAFSQFFGGAPVVEVSGRTYPVEVRYRPPLGEDEEERELDLPDAIVAAVEEAGAIDPLGDILVFLPGEREIRESAERLQRHKLRHSEVLPLFSRLSAADQDRVFQPHAGRRIVLATNVAETSLTVPGIRFVIDSGVARLSRYSHRTKVQRLHVEPISQASANQRAGRCGRVGPGICFRLYGEEDFANRPPYTDPEILRTNLAAVILQMLTLGLGDIEAFPFLAPPDRRYVSDGFRLLHELGAVDEARLVTPLGRQLARMPVDPRLGRMLVAAGREGCVSEVAIIASALSVQDPRERPAEAQQQADEAHRQHQDERSDFLAFVNLWNWYHEQARHLSGSKLRKLCRERFLSYLRMREWHDIHGQLLAVATELELKQNELPAEPDAIHRALLTGLLGNVAMKEDLGEQRNAPPEGKRRRRELPEYLGARGNKLTLFPGSALAKKPPKWVMAAELVETSRLFARHNAAIDVAWIEPLAGHLVKHSYSEPHWEKRAAQVAAFEQVSLYGLVIVARRRVNYGPIDPPLARELFIRHALVEGEYTTRAPFFRHNRELLEAVGELEAKARRRDLLVDEETLYQFYDQRIPAALYSGRAFEKWRREVEAADPQRLFLTREILMKNAATGVSLERFPDTLRHHGMELRLEYRFEPGEAADGVTVLVPLPALPRLSAAPFEWLVPGLLEEKLTALIKSLPKAIRRNFVPAVNFARAASEALVAHDAPLIPALSHQLLRITGVEVTPEAWDLTALPPHLLMNFRVVDEAGRKVAEGRDLATLQQGSAGVVRERLAEPSGGIERSGLTRWEFADLPESVTVRQAGLELKGWPALVDERESVALKLFESPEAAALRMGAGLRRLYMLEAVDKFKYLRRNLKGIDSLCLRFAAVGSCDELKEDLVAAIADRAFLQGRALPRSQADFATALAEGRCELMGVAERVTTAVARTLEIYHEVGRTLRGGLPPQRLPAAQEIREQLARLIYPGFVAATPDPWLERLPVYLEAVKRRLAKLERQLDRDRQYSRELAALWQQWAAKAQAQQQAGRPLPEPLVELRWQLEELRVSLFAQELGTVATVSVPRLTRRLAEL